jgi:hypothetical protein
MNMKKNRLVNVLFIILLIAQLSLILSPRPTFGNSTGYDLLIIAHEDFIEPLRELQEWKTRTGMPTSLISWQEYNRYTTWGYDAPERIKKGIELAQKTYGVKYVLLVGDSDMLPVRYTYTDRIQADNTPGGQMIGYGAYYAGDLYYADLYKQDGTFDNWDYNGNHIYGQLHGEYFTNDPINIDRIDMIPDVAVGRLPAHTVQDVENYVTKVIDYEFSTYEEERLGTTTEWFKSALFIVPYSPADDLDVIYLDAKENIARDSLTTARGFELTRLYDPLVSGTAASLTDGTPTEQLIKYWIHAGVGFVNYGGHGNRDVWDGVFYTWTLNNASFRNSNLPIILSVGCGTAQFAVQPPYETYLDIDGRTHLGIDYGELWPTPPNTPTLPQPASLQTDIHDSFPEHMLCYYPNKGAIGYVGCVTAAQAWSKILDEYFFQGYDEGVTLGDMWTNMVTQYCDNSKTVSGYALGPIGRGENSIKSGGDWFKVAGYHQPIKFMLFGDPSLRVGGLTNRPPRASISTPSGITITEGTTYSFNTAAYVFGDAEATPLTYHWDFNGDDIWDTDWTSATTISHTYNDDFTGQVKVQASDGSYQSPICTRDITVTNVAPTIFVHTGLPWGTGTPPSYRVAEEKTVRLETTVDDPGSDTFTYSWNFGEGATPETSTEANPTVTFAGPENTSPFMFESTIKTYNITLTVRDDDYGYANYRLTLEVVHQGLLDKMGGILGLTGIVIAAIAISITAIIALRYQLKKKAKREQQRPL